MVRLASSVAKHRKPRSEHDENGETDAEKRRVRCWDGVALATGTLPACKRVSLEETGIRPTDRNQLGYTVVVYIAQT
jgi:hypothetical protein